MFLRKRRFSVCQFDGTLFRMINIKNISHSFGGLKAVDGATFDVKKGSITGLIGPNGAGKTTLFNLIAGVLSPISGEILLNNEDVTNLRPHQLFGKGLLRTFQISQEFSSLSVKENLMMVPPHQSGEAIINTWINRKKILNEEQAVEQRASKVLDFLHLSNLGNEPARNLSGGQKKLLELGRTMMVDAKVVLLDEVGAGVNRTLLKDIGKAIIRMNERYGYTFCMIEHDFEFISMLCDPVVVMAEGKVLMEGTVSEIKSSDIVIEAYLGAGKKTDWI